MTISILTFDAKTGTYGGAACTGSLCVGGWVLRGDAESGLSAAQGSAPSTLWGTGALALMRAGTPAAEAVARLTSADTGAAHRQLAALDPQGGTGHFTGAESIPAAAARTAPDVVVSGNMLASEAVLDACLEGYLAATGPHPERLLAALEAADAAGGDSRGLLSAALLVTGRDMAPLTLRIDHADRPLAALRTLYDRSQTSPYRDWLDLVPTLDHPNRSPA
ncbi:hypothetical protein OG2516_08888 [Oceanicola granulosus HTCC2516]|uniref:Major pilin protein fimA n=1 Tax=Oceanicola granulosus (strain ATCC BAA-861 / DSM 15982 / KCTC 12143 / HTCC2516) TaxID=314256 RepID=Q2CCS2_OCEGH|nr:DUF1028 domain-containing protein [Oceanicola granulosus]EAR50441.1 hypothetical protein OG2516_08888 [Oceanicola granulosus HTCC2516]